MPSITTLATLSTTRPTRRAQRSVGTFAAPGHPKADCDEEGLDRDRPWLLDQTMRVS